MRRVRQLHLYLGTFFAPAIIFFAFTGAMQTFGLHEPAQGSGAPRPAWIAKLASIHKDQRLVKPRRKTPPEPAVLAAAAPKAPKGDGPSDEPKATGPSPLPLKIFVLLMAIGLVTTTSLGIYMAFKVTRKKAIVWALLAAGIIVPVALLYI